MSTVDYHHLQPIGGHAPQPKQRWPWAALAVGAAFFLGLAVGNAGHPSIDPCITALEYADEGFGYAEEVMNAIASFDAARVEAVTVDLSELAPKYNAAKAECRSSAN